MLDENYIKTMEVWFKIIDLEIEQNKNFIKFHEEEIELHKKMMEAGLDRLEHDIKRSAKAKKDFEDYIKQNSDDHSS